MKSFDGEATRKARFLRGITEEGGSVHRAAETTEINFISDHRRWLESDLTYRQAFEIARREGEQRQGQTMFNHLCDWFREDPDDETEQWILRLYGADALQAIKQGGYPRW